MEQECVACHANGTAEGGFGTANDLRGILSDGRITTCDGEASSIIQFMRNPTDGHEALPEWVVDGASAYIEDCIRGGPCPQDRIPPPSAAELVSAMVSDLQAMPESDRSLARFVSFAWPRYRDLSSPDLSMFQDAVRKTLQSTSTVAGPTPLRAVPGTSELVFRVQLDEVGWDRPFEGPEGPSRDGWELLVAAIPSALVSSVDGSEELRELTETRVPVLPFQSLVTTAMQHPIYPALVGLPATLGELDDALGVDRAANLLAGTARRAGATAWDEPSVRRMIERHPVPGRQNGYWLLYDFVADDEPSHDILQTPLGPALAGLGEGPRFEDRFVSVMYPLPNEFFVFGVYASDGAGGGTLLDRLPLGVQADPAIPTGEQLNAISCVRCHTGVIPVEDEVLPSILSGESVLDAETRSIVEALHVDPSAWRALTSSDTATFHSAQEGAGITLDPPIDAIAGTFQHYIDDVPAYLAALEMGVTTDELVDVVAGLPELESLAVEGGFVSREVWDANFVEVAVALGVGRRP